MRAILLGCLVAVTSCRGGERTGRIEGPPLTMVGDGGPRPATEAGGPKTP